MAGGNDELCWIAAHCRASEVQVWLMDAKNAVIDHFASDPDVLELCGTDYRQAILSLVKDVLPTDRRVQVLCCGMADAAEGRGEAPFLQVPCKPPTLAEAKSAEECDPRLDFRVLPGLSQSAPADIMRGEETRIAGFLAAEPSFDGIICLPGAQTRWAHISAGEVVSFRTFLTGELYALISERSILRSAASVGEWDDAAFKDALSDAISRPASVAADLFSIHADYVITEARSGAASARISGLLIGMELAAARPYWLGQEVVVAGDTGVAAAYRDALEAQFASVRAVSAEGLALRGLCAAFGGTAKSDDGAPHAR